MVSLLALYKAKGNIALVNGKNQTSLKGKEDKLSHKFYAFSIRMLVGFHTIKP
ncbi:hypothetical protein PPEP_a0483 [Pseudoalteromonas peptidolytica F12-50-A1]|uniref:Uncharacterized protein n=1 Tax=Pseudoalteromonas peptidolytica F12-50-A1 TaxID=1315280 RepID=A0A8I0MUI9_9GAMM|nr:hypothetical protein [Pseudoalteromonas peptidolytica F12-50-A1]GEK09346.1 hypothetical protein PPE03_15950 [Pseudoalteromonas peptidolytica]